MSRPISSDLVGLTFEPVEFSWGKKDVILYALGVGAKPKGELAFVFEGKGPKVLPTYAVIPGMFSMGGLVSNVEINLAMLLHGEQSITLHREIPPEATVRITGRVAEVWDKGNAAVIGSEGLVEDAHGPLGKDRYGRVLGDVPLPDGRALNHEIVKAGFAWWYVQYAPRDDVLKQLEQEARAAKRGLWAMPDPTPPWEWRHRK